MMGRPETSTAEELRASGFRATVHRVAALDWLDTHAHASAEQVYDGVRARLGSISKQAVYDLLAACVRAGLVRQIKPAGHAARFERRAGDNHHHVVCRQCGAIEDIDCLAGETPCLSPERRRGYTIDEAEVTFWGRCANCQSRAASPSGRPEPARAGPELDD